MQYEEPKQGGELSTAALLDAHQVAQMIGMTTDYVYALCRRDEIPHLTFGRTRRFRAEKIRQWLVDNESGGTNQS